MFHSTGLRRPALLFLSVVALGAAGAAAAVAAADTPPPTTTATMAAPTTTTAPSMTTAPTEPPVDPHCFHRVISQIASGRLIEIDIFYYGLKKGPLGEANTGYFLALALQKPGSTTWTYLHFPVHTVVALPGGWKWEQIERSPAKVVRGTYRLTVYPLTVYGNGHGGSCRAAPVSRFVDVR